MTDRKVVDYKMLSAKRAVVLSEMVTNLLNKGYIPYGEPVVHKKIIVNQSGLVFSDYHAEEPDNKFSQAMIKYEDKNDQNNKLNKSSTNNRAARKR